MKGFVFGVFFSLVIVASWFLGFAMSTNYEQQKCAMEKLMMMDNIQSQRKEILFGL